MTPRSLLRNKRGALCRSLGYLSIYPALQARHLPRITTHMPSSPTIDHHGGEIEFSSLIGRASSENSAVDAITTTSGASNVHRLSLQGRVFLMVRRYNVYVAWIALVTVLGIHSGRSISAPIQPNVSHGDLSAQSPTSDATPALSPSDETLIDILVRSEEDRPDGGWGATPTEYVYAVDTSSDSLYIINVENNQQVAYIGRLGGDDLKRFTTPGSVVIHPLDGRLLVWNNSPSEDYGLSVVDPSTGLAIRLGSWDPGGGISALLFHEGKLYGSHWDLFELDMNESVATKLCTLGMPIYAMTLDPEHGIIYGVDAQANWLVTIEPSSCTVTVVAELTEDIGVIGAILWDSERGSILGTSLHAIMFDLDPTNAAVSNIRSGESPQGMAWGVPSDWTAQPTMAQSLAPTPTLGAHTTSPSRDFTPDRLVYGVDSSWQKLYTLNVDTAEVQNVIGRLGGGDTESYMTPNAMTRHPLDGRLFVWNNSPSQEQGLSVVDPATGLATRLGPWSGVRHSLTFGVDGRLYAAYEDLYVIDLTNGRAKQSCILGMDIGALTTDLETGVMYGVSMSLHELVTINPASCNVTVIGRLSEDVGSIGAILWDSERGFILGSSQWDYVFNLDPVDATVSNIRQGIGPQGMAWVIPQGGTGLDVASPSPTSV